MQCNENEVHIGGARARSLASEFLRSYASAARRRLPGLSRQRR